MIYFSATDTTERTARGLAKYVADGLKCNIKEKISLLHTADRAKKYVMGKNDVLVMGLPVYEGRVPGLLVNTLKNMRGSDTPAVIAAVYGNRDFEDALLEIKNLLEANGFIVIAAAAFIGEHFFSRNVGTNRPNSEDTAIVKEFAEKETAKVQSVLNGAKAAPINVPGNFPYKEPLLNVADHPLTTDACHDCTMCADACPTDAVSCYDLRITDNKKCILCNACVRICPVDAKYFDNEKITKVVGWLENKFAERKEPELFL